MTEESTCISDNVDATSLCSSSVSSSSSSSSSCGQPGCCCCHYDPFADETQIRDLPFALRKLAVMKCQMRKWRLERLEIESQARSLKRALQSCGVEPNEVLKPDPVLVHLRAENIRLQRRTEELEDEVRDLSESLADRESIEEQPCDALVYLEEKMLAVRHRCAVEKRQMRESIASLQLKLQEAQDEGSCSALNRLRAKLRELMAERQRGDGDDGTDPLASLALEKSIETMGELSRGCDELKKENERLLAEVETLKREIKEDVTMSEHNLERGTEEISDLSRRVKSCEAVVSQMRLQLAEKDEQINELQKKLFAERQNASKLVHDLEQMGLAEKSLKDQIESMKSELNDKNSKIKDLLQEVRKSSEMVLSVNELENELERMRPSMHDLETRHDDLTSELAKLSKELAKKNEEINRLIAENKKNLSEQERKHLAEVESLKKELDTLRSDSDSLRKLQAELESCKLDNQSLKNETGKLNSQLQKAAKTADQLKATLESMRELDARLKNVESERDRLSSSEKELKTRLQQTQADLENMEAHLSEVNAQSEQLKNQLEKTRAEIEEYKQEGTCLRDVSDKLKSMGEAAEKQNAELQEKLDACYSNKDQLERELGDLKWQLDKLKKEHESTANELERLKEVNSALQTEQGQLKADNDKLKAEAKKSSLGDIDLANLNKMLDECKAENEQLKKSALKIESKVERKQDVVSKKNSTEDRAVRSELKEEKKVAVKRRPTEHKVVKNESTPVRKEGTVGKVEPEENDKQKDVKTVKDEAKEKSRKSKEKPKEINDTEIGDKCIEQIAQMSEALKIEMEKQIDALDRMREFINYAEGKVEEKPKMITDLNADGNDKNDWPASEINELFKTSRLLSGAIIKTEEEVQGLENLLKKRQGQDDCTFDAQSWLQSLSLKELAELHDRVCMLTSSLVRRNSSEKTDDCCRCDNPKDPRLAGKQIDARMLALQRRIVEKQREAAARANEMHRALLVEQARLIRLSDDVNRGRELNLALRLSVEAGSIPMASQEDSTPMNCCERLECARAGCAGDYSAEQPDAWCRK